MSKILNFFDDAYYINLDSRDDRRKLFETQCKELGIKAKRFSAIQPGFDIIPPNALKELQLLEPMTDESRYHKYRIKANGIGCTLSHKAVIKQARDQGLQNILIFEDDCKFLPAWQSEIKSVIEDLNKVDWDVVYFGGELNSNTISITNNLNLVVNGGVYCNHAYAVNKRFFDPIINFDIDWCPAPIDIFFLNYPSNSRKYVVSKKLLAIQESDWSDLRNENSNASQIQLINSWEKFVK